MLDLHLKCKNCRTILAKKPHLSDHSIEGPKEVKGRVRFASRKKRRPAQTVMRATGDRPEGGHVDDEWIGLVDGSLCSSVFLTDPFPRWVAKVLEEAATAAAEAAAAAQAAAEAAGGEADEEAAAAPPAQVHLGRLECPTCSAKVGSFSWVAEQCSCGEWVVPAARLLRSALDECPIV